MSPRRFFSCRRRSLAAAVRRVGTRRRSTRSARLSCSTSRSVASSRLRHWLRSSCATARRTGPARSTTRFFCRSVRTFDAATSNTASTRDSLFWACWPPGPLERENRSSISERGKVTERVTRIDSPSMAAILLDIEGVLHVSWNEIPGARSAVERLRENGHRLRFITNNTTRARRELALELGRMGIELDEEELQTTPLAAARSLAGKRVLALTMPRIIDDLRGIELVGDNADAVLIGGADETAATNQVFSYMNLARAFAELDAGAELYCLHRNRWWETTRGPLLDAGAFVAGLEYAAEIDAIVVGKPSTAYFATAIEALDAEPELTWMVGDALESDVLGAQRFGLRTALVRTGKFRPDELERSAVAPDVVLSSVADLPFWLEESL